MYVTLTWAIYDEDENYKGKSYNALWTFHGFIKADKIEVLKSYQFINIFGPPSLWEGEK